MCEDVEHAIRNSLATIKGSAQLMEKEILGERQKKYIGYILKETETAYDMIISSIKQEKVVNLEELKFIEDFYDGVFQTVTQKIAQRLEVNTDKILDAIKSYLSWRSGKSQSLAGVPFEISLMSALNYLVMILDKSGNRRIIKDYILIILELKY